MSRLPSRLALRSSPYRLLLCFLLGASLLAFSADSARRFQSDAQDLLEKSVACHCLSGLAAAVVRGNRSVFKAAVGRQDAARGIPLTSNGSLLLIASLSKAFSATLLSLRSVQERYNFSLTSPIRDFLPDLRLMDDQRTRYATLHDLLAHRMGVPRYDFLWISGAAKNYSDIARFMEVKAEFRSSFIYTNIMYNLAGEVLERLSGRVWADLMREYVFDALNMSNAFVVGDKSMPMERLIKSFSGSGKGKPLIMMDPRIHMAARFAQPAVGVALTLDDMERWLLRLASVGPKLDSVEALDDLDRAILATTHPANAYREMRAVRMKQFLAPDVVNSSNFAYPFPESYARGWQRHYYRGRLVLQHFGSLFGIRSNILWLPREAVAVFLSGNKLFGPCNSPDLLYDLALFLADLAVGSEPWLNAENACSSLSPPAPFPTSAPLAHLRPLRPSEQRRLPGQFHHPLFGQFWLRFDRARRRLVFHGAALLGSLELLPVALNDSNMTVMLCRMVGPLWFFSEDLHEAPYDRWETAEGSHLALYRHANAPVIFDATGCEVRLHILEPQAPPVLRRQSPQCNAGLPRTSDFALVAALSAVHFAASW